MQMSHQHHHQLTGKVKEASQQPRQSMGNLPPQQHYIHQPMRRIMLQQDQQFQRAQRQQMQFAAGMYSHPTGTVGDQDDQRMGTWKEETAIYSGDKKEAHSKQQVKHGPVATNPVLCVRSGCTNLAIANDDWDGEYCSNRCVVAHCREVFATCFNDSNPY